MKKILVFTQRLKLFEFVHLYVCGNHFGAISDASLEFNPKDNWERQKEKTNILLYLDGDMLLWLALYWSRSCMSKAKANDLLEPI